MQNDTATLEGSLIVSYKAKLLQYDPAKELFIIYPKQLKTCVYKKLKTQMLITALFVTAKPQKQPKFPSVGKWINKLISRQWNIIQH